MPVDPWRGTYQGINALREYAGYKEARRRTDIAEKESERNKDYHDIRMMAANFDIFKQKANMFNAMLPNLTQDKYAEAYQWATTPDPQLGGITIPAPLLVPPEQVSKMTPEQWDTFKVGMDKDLKKIQINKDFEAWKANLQANTQVEVEKIKQKGAIARAGLKEGGLGGIKSADVNAIWKQTAALFGGTWNPQTGEFTFTDKDSQKTAGAVEARAEQIFKDAKGDITHANAVKQAAEEYGVEYPKGNAVSDVAKEIQKYKSRYQDLTGQPAAAPSKETGMPLVRGGASLSPVQQRTGVSPQSYINPPVGQTNQGVTITGARLSRGGQPVETPYVMDGKKLFNNNGRLMIAEGGNLRDLTPDEQARVAEIIKQHEQATSPRINFLAPRVGPIMPGQGLPR